MTTTMRNVPSNDTRKLQLIAVRLLAVVIAAGIAYVGFAILTRPLAVPVTILLWIVAALIVLLAALVRLPDETAGSSR